MTEPIRAALSGYDTCCADGITAKASAPVLALCRKLVEAGYDPTRPLHAYRRACLALTVSAIAWGAKHTVKDSACGTPVLRPYRGQETMPAASLARPGEKAASSVHAST
jgi:hypothetical protein